MTPEQEALRAAYLAELWPTCREWHQTRDERDDARERNGLLARPQQHEQGVHKTRTGCAETGDENDLERHAECA